MGEHDEGHNGALNARALVPAVAPGPASRSELAQADEANDWREVLGRELAEHGLNANQVAWLTAFVIERNVAGACRKAGVSRTQYYRWMREQPSFASARETAMLFIVDEIEAVAIDRALHERDMGGRILEMILKAYKPERYGERVDHRHSGSVPVLVRFEGEYEGKRPRV